MEPSREILWNAGEYARIIIYLLMIIPLGLFFRGFIKRWRLWKMGKAEEFQFDRWGKRAKALLGDLLTHRRLLAKPYAGLMHSFLFW